MFRKYLFSIFYLYYLVVSIGIPFLVPAPVLAATEDKEPVVCDGDRVEYLEDEKKVVGTGNVVVTYKDVKLTADKVTIYPETKGAFAEGNVKLYKDDGIFYGEKLSYNFETKKGTVIKARFEDLPWYGRGEEVDKVTEKKVIVKRGYITTCELDPPHYRIQSRRIKIFLGDKVVAKHVLFFVGRYPILYMPYYSHPLNDDRPRVTVIPGKRKDWGFFVLTAWRYYFNDNARGYIRLDWRELKGVASGVDYSYRTQDYGEGFFNFYYMQERDKCKEEGVHAERQRYRVDYTHHWEISEYDTLFGEYHRYSDKDFRYDYFYDEYKKETQPESHISFARRRANYTFQIYLRKRTNRFEDVVEKLPEVSLDISSVELGETNFYYQGEWSVSNLNKKQGHSAEDTDACRVDNYNQISYPTKFPGILNWISFTPYLGGRQTYYSKDREGTVEHFMRGIYYGGFDLTTKFYRIFNVNCELWNIDINNLRHVIQPSIEYDYIHRPTVQPAKLGSFDSIDSIDKSNVYTFSIENTLQTKWPVESSETRMEKIDLVRFLTKVYFYPHPQELVSPFSNIYFELDLKPYRWLTAEIDSSYDHSTRDFDTVNIDLKAEKQSWDFSLGSRYVKETYCEVTADFNYTLNDKWKFGIYERYDFKTATLNEQEYRISRDLHCWLVDLTYNIKDYETIWIVFRIKAFPEIPFEFTTSYHIPKPGSEIPPSE